jgi:hypothetical protein
VTPSDSVVESDSLSSPPAMLPSVVRVSVPLCARVSLSWPDSVVVAVEVMVDWFEMGLLVLSVSVSVVVSVRVEAWEPVS